ncbi:MAG: carbohydrate ABC transporter permease [Treponema sp.]|jgi:raffinose/stachyose/melibiose transport system permease protein|nr:carbohydrate ABC transporter permease [Treponema sp.]
MGKKNEKAGTVFFKIAGVIIAAVFAAAVIYPLVFIVMSSLKTNNDIIMNPFGMASFNPGNYFRAWNIAHIGRYFLSSAYVSLMSLLISLLVIIPAAYALGKLKPHFGKIIMAVLLSGMFITSEMTTIPNFTLLKSWGMYNTHWGLILPYVAAAMVLGIYILAGYVELMPREIEEAALIDGAGVFRTMVSIDLPMMLPPVVTVAILSFQNFWSEFYWALIIIQSNALKTLPLGMMNFQSQYATDYGILSAGIVIMTIPLVALYIFGSERFVGGVTAGALKG